ncbi:MAG: hypothetical protein ABFD54_05875 [Armatimonadota bacterium]|nr:hypothetical protein [bacterium]
MSQEPKVYIKPLRYDLNAIAIVLCVSRETARQIANREGWRKYRDTDMRRVYYRPQDIESYVENWFKLTEGAA